MTEKSYYIQQIKRELHNKTTAVYWEVRDNRDICMGRYRNIDDARNKLRFLNDQLDLPI